MGFTVNVQIRSASNIGGRYPFIVVCFDADLSREVYKTSTAVGGAQVVWNDAFPLDLRTQFKNISADGKKEPTYMTFFIFDGGVQGNPSLGSAGVLLSNVRDKGIAEGDFPVINGTGTLNLSVEAERTRFDWIHSDKAKFAAGAVGVGAVAAGLTALAINQSKKSNKKENKEKDRNNQEGGQDGDRKNKLLHNLSKIPGIRALTGNDSSSEEEERERVNPTRRRVAEGYVEPSAEPYAPSDQYRPSARAGRANLQQRDVQPDYDYARTEGVSAAQSRLAPHERPWWDVESDEDNGGGAAGGYVPNARPARAPKATLTTDKYVTAGATEEKPSSVHIHYHDGAPNLSVPGQEDLDEQEPHESVYEHHVRVQEPNRTSEYIEHGRASH